MTDPVRQQRSILRCTQPIDDPIRRHRNTDRVGNRETNRTQLEDDPTIDDQHTLDPMSLRVIQADHITYGQITSGNLLRRHDPSVGRRPNWVTAYPATDRRGSVPK